MSIKRMMILLGVSIGTIAVVNRVNALEDIVKG